MKYQFRIDNRSAGPLRETWQEAAWDAVENGAAHWVSRDQIVIDEYLGAAIIQIEGLD